MTCSCSADFVVAMEEVPGFQMDMTFLEPPVIADCPPLGFPSLEEEPYNSPFDSDISDSCPPSPSPVSSPSPHSSSSSESGIEDVSDMEEATCAFHQTVNGSLIVKAENPSSPLNAMNQPPVNSVDKKRRKSSRRSQNDSSVLEELNKLLVETSVSSLASALMNNSGSPPYQTQTKITGLDDMMVGVQTTASPTSGSLSCPLSGQASQATTLASGSCPVSVSTTTATVTKISTLPPVSSPSRIRSKPTRNPKKPDEPKIVIIEEPEEVLALKILLSNYQV